jgi:hypothetical protein
MTDQLGWCDRAAARRPNAKEDEMSVTLVRQKVKDGSVEEAEAAARDLFATLDRLRPRACTNTSRVVDSSTFVIVTELAQGIEYPRADHLRVPAVPGAAQGLGGRSLIEHRDVEVRRRLEMVGRMPTYRATLLD